MPKEERDASWLLVPWGRGRANEHRRRRQPRPCCSGRLRRPVLRPSAWGWIPPAPSDASASRWPRSLVTDGIVTLCLWEVSSW